MFTISKSDYFQLLFVYNSDVCICTAGKYTGSIKLKTFKSRKTAISSTLFIR